MNFTTYVLPADTKTKVAYSLPAHCIYRKLRLLLLFKVMLLGTADEVTELSFAVSFCAF